MTTKKISFGIFISAALLVGAFLVFDTPSQENSEISSEYIFTHTKYGYSFTLPNELSTTFEKLGNHSEIATFSNSSSTLMFQIFTTPYGKKVITEERLRLDIGEGVLSDFTDIVIGTSAIPAVMFWNDTSEFGRVREVWFIHDDFLYEVSTVETLDTWLADIIKTLNFKSDKL